jgi:hypothetical protein
MVIRNGYQIMQKQHRVIHLPPVGQVSRLSIGIIKPLSIIYYITLIQEREEKFSIP